MDGAQVYSIMYNSRCSIKCANNVEKHGLSFVKSTHFTYFNKIYYKILKLVNLLYALKVRSMVDLSVGFNMSYKIPKALANEVKKKQKT